VSLNVTPIVNTIGISPKVLGITVNGVSTNVATTTQQVNISTQVANLSLVTKESVIDIVTVGVQGPEGPAGAGVSEPAYRFYDSTSEANTYYKGWSNSDSTSTATTKILKGVEVSPDDFIETWAEGSDFLDKIWDNRLSLTYF